MNLSEAQKHALKVLRLHDGMTRLDLYYAGIRMSTIYSLCRRGLVYRKVVEDSSGRQRVTYHFENTTHAIDAQGNIVE